MRGVICALALAALLLACGGDGGSAVSGISGRVVWDPPCGSEGTACPASGVAVLHIRQDGQQTMIPARTDPSGNFRVPLAPASYIVTVQPDAVEGAPAPPPSGALTVVVRAGVMTPVEITYRAD